MGFSILHGNIAAVHADAVVNAANPHLLPGGGVCGAIFQGAGRRELEEACRAIGYCPTGQAVATPGFRLPARWIIHTPGPVWHGGGHGEEQLLASCYRSCLELAKEYGCKSVDFPSISTGVYHFPLDRAADIAIGAIADFLKANPEIERVRMVCFDEKTKAHYDRALAQLDK